MKKEEEIIKNREDFVNSDEGKQLNSTHEKISDNLVKLPLTNAVASSTFSIEYEAINVITK